jgi:hypothetical protein
MPAFSVERRTLEFDDLRVELLDVVATSTRPRPWSSTTPWARRSRRAAAT